MKIFDTFQKLWNYCLYCPICKNYNRNINVSLGPDDNFELMGCCKVGSEVRILCKYYHQGWRGSSCLITFIINTTNNTYEVKTSGTPPATDVAKDSYFFCYLHAKCQGCNYSYLNTADIEFNHINKTISNIKMDQEGVYLVSEKDKFHISLSHERNIMMVSRFEEMGEATIDDPNIIELPLANLDFSDANKTINRIKTFILFS
jgi:hypothetical protein